MVEPVVHLGTNPAKCRATMLIKINTLPVSQTATLQYGITVNNSLNRNNILHTNLHIIHTFILVA